jgi:hypothetical protein
VTSIDCGLFVTPLADEAIETRAAYDPAVTEAVFADSATVAGAVE